MSELYNTIRKDFTEARKSRNTIQASLLSTLIGQLQTESDGKPETLDDDRVVRTVRKFLVSVEETIKLRPSDSLVVEKDTLERYLPKMLSDAELEAKIKEIIASGATTMKDVMPKLKELGPIVDMKVASGMVKNLL